MTNKIFRMKNLNPDAFKSNFTKNLLTYNLKLASEASENNWG